MIMYVVLALGLVRTFIATYLRLYVRTVSCLIRFSILPLAFNLSFSLYSY